MTIGKTSDDLPKLSDAHARHLEAARKISGETIARFGIYTAKWRGKEIDPDLSGNVIAFPSIESGRVVNVKYRWTSDGEKHFSQSTGGKQIFWNIDVLDDPIFLANETPLVITEGEIDALTAIDCGKSFVVSVPSGAPPVPQGRKPEDLDPLDASTEATGKFEFMFTAQDKLKKIKRFVIAVDNDPPGQRLAAELVRRLGPSRCLFVTYPEYEDEDTGQKKRCKDLNEVRQRFDRDKVIEVIDRAQPYPVHGLYRLDEFPDLEDIKTWDTGWWTLNECFKPFLGGLVFVLGIPGAGKSIFIANLLINLAEKFGFKSAVFTPEEPVVPFFRSKLRRIKLRGDPMPIERDKIKQADAWLRDHVLFIASDPQRKNDEEVYLDWLLGVAKEAVIRDGIKILVIDPWNEVEQLRKKGESQTEYIARAIRAINAFRHEHGVLVFVAIHPTKEVGKDGKSRWPTAYDADGSAAFFNKADHFLIVHRDDQTPELTSVRVVKCKFEGTGKNGTTIFRFDRDSWRYELRTNTTAEEAGL